MAPSVNESHADAVARAVKLAQQTYGAAG